MNRRQAGCYDATAPNVMQLSEQPPANQVDRVVILDVVVALMAGRQMQRVPSRILELVSHP